MFDLESPHPPNRDEYAVDVIAIEGKGDLYVTGRAYNALSPGYNPVTIRYQKGGGLLWWQTRYWINGAPMCMGALRYIVNEALPAGGCNDRSWIYLGCREYGGTVPTLLTVKYKQEQGCSP